MTLESVNGALEVVKLKKKTVGCLFRVRLAFESKLSELTKERARLRI